MTHTASSPIHVRRFVGPLVFAVVALAVSLAVSLTHPFDTSVRNAANALPNSAVCAPTRATAYPDGEQGVAVYVNAPGPDVVAVDITGGVVGHRHLSQQVTRLHGSGAEFDSPYSAPADSIIVSTDKLGVCTVPVPRP